VTDVRIADAEDAEELGRVLAEGFSDDPVMCWVFAEEGRRGNLGVFFGFLAREALVPLGASYVLPGSCANWTPPGTPDWPEDRSRRFGGVLEEILSEDEMKRLGVLGAAMDEHRPREVHWYLGSIATVPESRNRGQGAALLRESLARVDQDGLPAYLESSNPMNVPLYERHGFSSVGTIELPGGPSLTAMWRDGRGPARGDARGA
jgi:ribosomal protein S18 acetylase RimI-like enzyme